MQQKFTVTETVNYPMETVWSVLKKTSDLNIHGVNKRDRISDTEWIEHTTDEISNHCTATVNDAAHTVEVRSENSKYKGEWDDITFTVKAAGDGQTEVTIDYQVATKAVFNMLAFKFFGDKIAKFSEGLIFKHIEENCKKLG